jgi:hypothetical protein
LHWSSRLIAVSSCIARKLGGYEARRPGGKEDSNLINIYIFYRVRFFSVSISKI